MYTPKYWTSQLVNTQHSMQLMYYRTVHLNPYSFIYQCHPDKFDLKRVRNKTLCTRMPLAALAQTSLVTGRHLRGTLPYLGLLRRRGSTRSAPNSSPCTCTGPHLGASETRSAGKHLLPGNWMQRPLGPSVPQSSYRRHDGRSKWSPVGQTKACQAGGSAFLPADGKKRMGTLPTKQGSQAWGWS